jgi:hypothetical protein
MTVQRLQWGIAGLLDAVGNVVMLALCVVGWLEAAPSKVA